MNRMFLPSVVAVLAIGVAACGGTAAGDDTTTSANGGVAAGMCAVGATECVDTVVEPDAAGATEDEAALLADAEALLGTAEEDLPADVRVGRRGDESMALTEDYRIGRMTVELDPDGDNMVVTRVTLELTDGPVVVDA